MIDRLRTATAKFALVLAVLAAGLSMAPAVAGAQAGPPWRVTAWGFGSKPSLEAAVAANGLDEVDVDWYFSHRDGHLGVADNVKVWFVDQAHAAGIDLYATITNRLDEQHDFSGDIAQRILSTPFRRQHHAAHLVSLCLKNGYQGIDLDWEMIYPSDRARFSAFVEVLGQKLHARGLKLAIAVFPKTSEPGLWDTQKPYDYRRLGRAVNEFKIMCYPYHGSWTAPGPICPPGWADQILTFAATRVAQRKIFLAIPFFGFDWYSGTAAGLHWDDAQALIANYGVTPTRTSSKEMTFRYRRSGVRHTVYYQDVGAIAAKLHLIRSHHPRMGGISIWVMGGEDPLFWTKIQEKLKPGETPTPSPPPSPSP